MPTFDFARTTSLVTGASSGLGEQFARQLRILALCPDPVATGYFASLGDQAATSSIIYRRTADPADVVRAGLRKPRTPARQGGLQTPAA